MILVAPLPFLKRPTFALGQPSTPQPLVIFGVLQRCPVSMLNVQNTIDGSWLHLWLEKANGLWLESLTLYEALCSNTLKYLLVFQVDEGENVDKEDYVSFVRQCYMHMAS